MGPDSRRLLAFFASTRALVAIVALLAVLYLPKFQYYDCCGHHTLGYDWPLDVFVRWDAVWYLRIATLGYSFAPDSISTAGWFPLYPLLIAALSVAMDPAIAGLLISHAGLLFAIFMLYRLAGVDLSRKASRRTVLYTLAFPPAIFFSMIYSESLFLALSASAFYFARRGRWREAGILGLFSALARPIGLMLLPAFVLEYAVQKGLLHGWKLKPGWPSKLDRSLWWLVLIPAGTAAFAAYLQLALGNVFAYVETQAIINRFTYFPLSSFFEPLWKPVPEVFLGFAYGLFGLSMVWLMRNRLRKSYTLYSFLVLLLPLSTGALTGMHRYILVTFPIAMMLAVMSEGRRDRHFHYPLTALFVALLAIYAVLYANGWPIH
jgi:hypothetical protein